MQQTEVIQHSTFKNVIDSIGNTPLIELNKVFAASNFKVYGKMEAANPSGSLKDRTSVNILKEALLLGYIKPGDTIIESSSGNMALGLAQACLYFKLKLIVVVDPKINSHTKKLLNAYDAKIDYVTKPDPEKGFLGARLQRVHELLENIPNSFWTNQYGNKKNPEAHLVTMKEMFGALQEPLDYLFVTVSTCGTLMGCADYISQNDLKTKLIAVDALGSILFGDEKSNRLIPGHGSSVKSNFLDKNFVHDAVKVSDLECVKGCWSLLKNEGILAGGSTGGAISAINKYVDSIPNGSSCGMIICDRGERYLDTIYSSDWILDNFNSKDNNLSFLNNE